MRNKNNIRKQGKSYKTWLEEHEGYDALSSEGLGDTASPYYIKPLPPLLEDVYEKLETLYYSDYFKGRQKQILKLLLEGETNQTIIAKVLRMKQCNVSVELQKIREKLSEKII